MIKRTISKKIKSLSNKYPVILVTGPRQSGKTTLVRNLFPDYEYKNLENSNEKLAASKDPRGFLNIDSGQKIIIDEFQEVPEIASFVQTEVDKQDIMSQFVLTGSQNLKISQTVSQSLAGRVANFELLPLSYNELAKSNKSISLDKYIFNGSYPRKYERNIDMSDFYRDYIDTYVTRDVRLIKNIGNLTNFQRFMQLLAGRVGQILNLSSISDDVGVSVKTIDSWLSILEASYIVFRLQPYYENFGKRAIKSPKVYFYDTGLLCYMLGINSIKELSIHYIYGHIFENLIILEKLKNIWNKRLNEKIYFWRDNHGNEIDLLIDKGLDKVAIEIKSSRTFSKNSLKGLNTFKSIVPTKYNLKTQLIYAGDIEQSVNGHELINWSRGI